MRSICEDVVAIEMGAGGMAGSLAGMMLADNGARVIKLEPPEGDRLRTEAPSAFLVWNRGKEESIVVDLRTPDGREQTRNLASEADVVIEGFGAGVADEWNLGYDALGTLNPRLVYCSIRGFSSEGPYANLKAYEGVIAAKAGWFQRGVFAYRPGPIYVNLPLGSHGAAHLAVAGIAAALGVREQTGRGQRVEVSMLQGLNAFDYFNTMIYQNKVRNAGKSRPAGVYANRIGLMACSKDNRWFVLNTLSAREARALVRACGLEYILEDPRFKDAPVFSDAETADEYEMMIWEVFRSKTAAAMTELLLSERDIAFEVAGSTEEAMVRPQVVHNGHVVPIEDPMLGGVLEIGPIACFSETPSQIERSAPELGQHGSMLAVRKVAPAPAGPAALAFALSGVTILEFGYYYAMPFGLTMAAALGARVIKLEGPSGDPMRKLYGAPEVAGAKLMEGKESLGLDLSTSEAQEVVYRLAATANAFVCGFRSGVAERLGLDYDSLRAINPNLVYLHATGYGTTGPFSDRPLYAHTGSALAGGYYRYAGHWLRSNLAEGMSVPELRAVFASRLIGMGEGDGNGALGVISALSLALLDQRRTGKGQFLTTSMINSNLYMLSDDFTSYEGKESIPLADPELQGVHALYRLYAASKGWVFLAVLRQPEWQRFVDALGIMELRQDERFATELLRLTHDAELTTILTGVFATKSADEWESILTSKDVACVEVNDSAPWIFTSRDTGLSESGLTAEVEHPVFGRIVRHGLPVVLSETPGRVAPGCLKGQHTAAILEELGYSVADVHDLVDRGIAFT